MIVEGNNDKKSRAFREVVLRPEASAARLLNLVRYLTSCRVFRHRYSRVYAATPSAVCCPEASSLLRYFLRVIAMLWASGNNVLFHPQLPLDVQRPYLV